MAESFWDAQAAGTAQPEAEPAQPAAEPGALTMSVDDFSALEERILRAVELVKHERQARLAAETRAAQAEAELREQAPRMEQLQSDLHALQAERESVRRRVETLLAQLDALEL